MGTAVTRYTTATRSRYDAGVDDVAIHLGVSSNTVRRMVADREIPYIRAGRQLRFRLEDVERALAGDA